MNIKDVSDFLAPVYDLLVSRVWRGYGNVIFLELGKLKDEKGEYTLWIDTGLWKLIVGETKFDGDKEEYDAIDKEIQKLIGLKISKIDFQGKKLTLSLGNTNLVCFPDEGHFAYLIKNGNKNIYLNFETDGTVSITDGQGGVIADDWCRGVSDSLVL